MGEKTWRVPTIGIPPNHPFVDGFSLINHPFLDTPIYGNPHIISMSEITSSMTTTATRLGTCFSFLLGAFCASGLVALLLLLLGSGAESAAEAASSKFAGRTCGNIWTHTHIYIYIYLW
jgi:hypothetical protein